LIPPDKNPPTVKCFFLKSTNCNTFALLLVGFRIKHFAVGGLSEQALCSWLVIGTSTLQLVDLQDKHTAVDFSD